MGKYQKLLYLVAAIIGAMCVIVAVGVAIENIAESYETGRH